MGTHHGASGQEILELAGTEAGQPGLQADVRRERSLGLQAVRVTAPRDAGLLMAACWSPRTFVTFDAGIDVGLGAARLVSAFIGMTIIPVRFWHIR